MPEQSIAAEHLKAAAVPTRAQMRWGELLEGLFRDPNDGHVYVAFQWGKHNSVPFPVYTDGSIHQFTSDLPFGCHPLAFIEIIDFEDLRIPELHWAE